MPAAPTLAAVAVILRMEREYREAGDERGEMTKIVRKSMQKERGEFPRAF